MLGKTISSRSRLKPAMLCNQVIVMKILMLCNILLILNMLISPIYSEPAASSQQGYQIGDPIPNRRVAVMNLKVSGEYSEQVKDWLPALIEDCLLKEGWTLVVRGEKMEHVQQERNLPGIKPETKLPDNELLGATAFIELNARIQVKDIQGIIGYKVFSLGDYVRASVDLNGQIVDPATGVLKSSLSVGGSASGLKTAAAVTIGSDWRIGASGYNLQGVRETLVGKAADVAAGKLLMKLRELYCTIPSQRSAAGLQPASTTVSAESSVNTILINLPDSTSAAAGDRYGIYRAGEMIAEVEITHLAGKRAEAKIISQTQPIAATDTARKMPVVIGTE